MATADDLERWARLAGVAASRDTLERLAPLLETLYADLERLTTLSAPDVAPAFTPRLLAAVPDEERSES